MTNDFKTSDFVSQNSEQERELAESTPVALSESGENESDKNEGMSVGEEPKHVDKNITDDSPNGERSQALSEESELDDSSVEEDAAQCETNNTSAEESDAKPVNNENQLSKAVSSADEKSTPEGEVGMELEEISSWIEELNTALDEGQLKKCTSLFEKCQARLKKLNASESKNKKLAKIQKKLNALHPRIRELKKWRHWGTDQARAELIKQLDTLKQFTGNPRDLSDQILEIRRLWKKWNQSGDYPNRALRDQFEKAYDEAFAPCKQFFKEQKKQRKSNLKLRKEICKRLEETFELTDWSRPDWAAIGTQIRNERKQWKIAVPLNKKDWNTTNTRFDKIMKEIEPHLERERERGVRFRLQLIENVEALSDVPLKVAIEKVKGYQQDWKTTTIRGRRKKENELWENFRTACDKQFQRRSNLRHATEQRHKQSFNAKKALLDEIKKLNELPTNKVREFASTASRIRQQWKDVVNDKNRSSEKLDAKFNHEFSKFQTEIRKANQLAAEAILSNLESKANLCDEAEQNVESSDTASVLESVRKKWDKIELDCGEHEDAIRNRFEFACNLLKNGYDKASDYAVRAENLKSKQDICLRLEILLEVDSPPEFARERMLQNVERLNAAMSKQITVSDPDEEIQQFLVKFWLTGAVPHDSYGDLKNRFANIRTRAAGTS